MNSRPAVEPPEQTHAPRLIGCEQRNERECDEPGLASKGVYRFRQPTEAREIGCKSSEGREPGALAGGPALERHEKRDERREGERPESDPWKGEKIHDAGCRREQRRRHPRGDLEGVARRMHKPKSHISGRSSTRNEFRKWDRARKSKARKVQVEPQSKRDEVPNHPSAPRRDSKTCYPRLRRRLRSGAN